MDDIPLPEPELPPSLRFLKRLVTVLTITMILGVITVVGLLVTRLTAVAPVASLPANASHHLTIAILTPELHSFNLRASG